MIGRPLAATRRSKSWNVHRWMFGVSYHWCGRWFATGMRPRVASCRRQRQWPKFGKVTTHSSPMRSISSSSLDGSATACSVSVITTMSKLSSGNRARPWSRSCSITFTPARTQALISAAPFSMP